MALLLVIVCNSLATEVLAYAWFEMARKFLSEKELEKYLYESGDEDSVFESSSSTDEEDQGENVSDLEAEDSNNQGMFIYLYLGEGYCYFFF